jgi:hypothetical protein
VVIAKSCAARVPVDRQHLAALLMEPAVHGKDDPVGEVRDRSRRYESEVEPDVVDTEDRHRDELAEYHSVHVAGQEGEQGAEHDPTPEVIEGA